MSMNLLKRKVYKGINIVFRHISLYVRVRGPNGQIGKESDGSNTSMQHNVLVHKALTACLRFVVVQFLIMNLQRYVRRNTINYCHKH